MHEALVAPSVAADATAVTRPGPLSVPAPSLSGLLNHPLRQELLNELHSRPYTPLSRNERIAHLLLFFGERERDRTLVARNHSHMVALCNQYRVPPPGPDDIHFQSDFGGFRLRWERHTEYDALVVYRNDREGLPDDGAMFDQSPLTLLPAGWLASLEGMVLAAGQVAVVPRKPSRGDAAVGSLRYPFFVASSLTSSQVLDGQAQIWTDFRIHDDGCTRLLVEAGTLDERDCGRLVQRLIELDHYRTLTLLAVPMTKQLEPKITALDGELLTVTEDLGQATDVATERALLGRLAEIWAEIAQLAAHHSYRFSATAAYDPLVRQRMERLRESRVVGWQRYTSFVERRLDQAVRHADTLRGRLEDLQRRVNLAADLLRTRVNVHIEEQNVALLQSMDRRARLQLRLQTMVEGLSVIAISYYAVSLLGYVLEGAATLLPAADKSVLKAVAVVPMVAAIWLFLRRVKAKLHG